jgi:dTDP-4-amino-4,6-dideoxygalactose transaminase
MDPIVALCHEHDIPLIEDAAESLGAKYKDRPSGTFGEMGIYSFNGNKIITTSGGGMLVSDNPKWTEKARFLATQARDPAPHYQHTEIGYNYRMSNILAGIGRGQLKVLDERIASRREIFQRYKEALMDVSSLEWMPEPDWSHSTHWLSACTIAAHPGAICADELIKRLSAEMIEARPIWKPMHLQPVFAHCTYFRHDETISVADDIFARGICLPSGSNMNAHHQDRVIETLRLALARG